jgi:hypothetical protein
MRPDLDSVIANAFDGLVENNLSTIHLYASGFEKSRDILGSHGPEERPGLA